MGELGEDSACCSSVWCCWSSADGEDGWDEDAIKDAVCAFAGLAMRKRSELDRPVLRKVRVKTHTPLNSMEAQRIHRGTYTHMLLQNTDYGFHTYFHTQIHTDTHTHTNPHMHPCTHPHT